MAFGVSLAMSGERGCDEHRPEDGYHERSAWEKDILFMIMDIIITCNETCLNCNTWL